MKFYLVLLGLLWSVLAAAIPAKPGFWRMLTLADGTEVRACLCGDERVHFWMAEDGRRFVDSGDVFVPVSRDELAARLISRRPSNRLSSRLLSPKKVQIGERTHYHGKKKGLVLLAQFSDVKFKAANNLEKYQRILNEPGYKEDNFKGSVYDYFMEQSAGQFELDFDVLGPFTLKYSQKYYGGNDSDGNDLRPWEMIIEACQQADSLVNFRDYDWDGDGVVDQVFVVYAGKGEADSGVPNTVWPHMDSFDVIGIDLLQLDSVFVNTYACANEIDPSNRISGIGSFCHEFSHCLGFPDFYDVTYSGNYGMGAFDLMAAGSYRGSGFLPVGYTAHEKMMCGWQEPTVLDSVDVEVDSLLPMSKHGETFVIYNDGHPDEYFMIENRQLTGFDRDYPSRGLLITHVDFDPAIWLDNIPNSIISQWEAIRYELKSNGNDHQRMTLMHADNDDDSNYWMSSYGYYYKTTEATDLYPYRQNDSLTATSKPAPKLFHANANGKKTVEWGITNIRQNDDGTMSFHYRAPGSKGTITPPDTTATKDYLFRETFDKCTGKGGNDGLWNGAIASSAFTPDNEGWSALSDKAYGASACAKFGTSEISGIVTSPAITISGEAVLTFKAGGWNATTEPTSLLVEADNATVTPSSFEMEKGAFQEFKATLQGNGDVRLTFTPGRRFFLDDVLVVAAPDASGIRTVRADGHANRIYTLDGRFAGTDLNTLRPGLYVVNGKKIIR